MQDLTGRTAFVTGAASGIGLGIATALSHAGVNVMLCDIEEEALATAVAKLKLTNADVDGVRADVSLKADLQAAADATVSRYGKVHILVNNAGVAGGRGYGHWTDAGWNWVLDVNLMSVIWGIEIFGPLIEAHGEGGQIVSTASVFGLIAGGSPQYDVTKYGVVALSEGLREALAPRKIGVSVLCPGVVRTQIFNFRRNVPQRIVEKIGSPPTEGPIADIIKALQERINKFGIDPFYVGELVREAIEDDLALHLHRHRARSHDRQALRRDQAGLRPHPRKDAAALAYRSLLTAAFGTKQTCRPALTMSVARGRPEVAGRTSKRRD